MALVEAARVAWMDAMAETTRLQGLLQLAQIRESELKREFRLQSRDESRRNRVQGGGDGEEEEEEEGDAPHPVAAPPQVLPAQALPADALPAPPADAIPPAQQALPALGRLPRGGLLQWSADGLRWECRACVMDHSGTTHYRIPPCVTLAGQRKRRRQPS